MQMPSLLRAKSNSEVYLKKEMLVTKFSTGKYRKEGELCSEPISRNDIRGNSQN